MDWLCHSASSCTAVAWIAPGGEGPDRPWGTRDTSNDASTCFSQVPTYAVLPCHVLCVAVFWAVLCYTVLCCVVLCFAGLMASRAPWCGGAFGDLYPQRSRLWQAGQAMLPGGRARVWLGQDLRKHPAAWLALLHCRQHLLQVPGSVIDQGAEGGMPRFGAAG